MSFCHIPDDILIQHIIPALLNTQISYPIPISQIYDESKNEYNVGTFNNIEYFNIKSYINLYKFSLLNRKCYKLSKDILQQAKKHGIHRAVKLFVHYLSMGIDINKYIKLDKRIIKDFFDGGTPILDDYISIINKPINLYIDPHCTISNPINEYIFNDKYISILKTIDRITFVNQIGFNNNYIDNIIYRNDFDIDIITNFNIYYFCKKYTLEVQHNKLTWIDIIIALYNIKSLKIGDNSDDESIACIEKYAFIDNELTLYYDIS